MAVIDAVILKGRCVVIPERLQKQALEQLHINHMGIEIAKCLTYESIYWKGMNSDIEKYIEIVLHVLSFSRHS